METRERARARAVKQAQNVLAGLLGAFWVLPMLVFWYEAFDARRPLVPLGYLVCSLGGFVAAFLPESYFRPRSFESARFYEAVGVRQFGRFMMHGEFMNRRIRKAVPGYRFLSGRDSMRRVEAGTRESERGHVLMLGCQACRLRCTRWNQVGPGSPPIWWQ